MHSEERGETADRHRDGVLNESGEELYAEYNLVSGTDPPVEENEITWARQVPYRDVLRDDYLSLAQWHHRTEIQTGRVHKYATQDEQTPRGLGPIKHEVTRTYGHDVPPIVLHSHQASSHLLFTDY